MPEHLEAPIEKEMQSSYIDYAMSVIVGRALPDARDGLKPVQRRILYGMYLAGNTHSHPTRKSAKITGDIMGRFHPHGDAAIYDAIVRMTQNFSMNHPLVHGQGNMGCFTKDTKIRLSDGRNLSFGKLIDEQTAGKRHWTFAFNTDTNLIEIAEIKNPRCTRRMAELVSVTFDNGEVIECTPDHRFLMRDGGYKEAKDLVAGSSLMPLYIKLSDGKEDKNLKNYETVLQPNTGKWQFIHHLSDEWNINNRIYARAKGRVRHHIDFDKTNNNPNNIIRLGWKEHWELHHKMASWRHKNDPEYVRKLAEGRSKYIEENRGTFSARLADRNRKNWKDPKYRERRIAAVKTMWRNSDYRARMSAVSSAGLKNRWKSKEFQELMSRTKSAEMKNRWKNEQYKLHMQQLTSKLSAKRFENPKYRQRVSETLTRVMNEPKRIEKSKRTSKALWLKPEYRAHYPDGFFSKIAISAWSKEEYRLKQSQKTRMQWKDPVFRSIAIENSKNVAIKRFKEDPGYMVRLSLISSAALHEKWKDPDYKVRVISSRILKYTASLLNKYPIVTPEIYGQNRYNNCIPTVSKAAKYFPSFEKMLEEAKTLNHKVVSVVWLEKKDDVYDITIDSRHNFSLSAGVFAHNSIDGDNAAAQRYTEVRLEEFAESMLEDIDKESVPFVPNYDNTEQEPLILPSKIPNLLVNGSAGIAVGVATNILPHNLGEVCDAVLAYLDNRDITASELMNYVKGPDFPTGGSVFHSTALTSSYTAGRGTVVIRAKTVTEKLKNRTAIIVTEVPYNVNKAAMVSEIANNVRSKRVTGISDLRDESGKDGIRVVIELKQDAEPDFVLNQLYKHTQLQTSMPVMNIAVIDKHLVTLNLRSYIKTFVDHRVDVIKKRTAFDLKVASDRLHIVDGLIIAVKDIDSVISTIKKSADLKEARSSLISGYGVTEIQANAILDMKLSKLTSLETSLLESEKTELASTISNLNFILANESKVYQIIGDETKAMKQTYARPRRTIIDYNAPIQEFSREDLLTDDETTIILTKNNYIKRLPTGVYRAQDRGGKGIIAIELKEGDFVKQIATCLLKDYLLMLSNKGRAYWLKAYMVPEESRYSIGKAAVNLVKLSEGEKIETIINTRTFAKSFLTFITVKGRIKRTEAEHFSHPRSNGINAIPILAGDELADACLSDGQSELLIATKLGKSLRFMETDIRPMGRTAQGIRGIRLGTNDSVVNIIPARAKDIIASITENGYGKVTELEKYRLQKRGGKGVINVRVKEKVGDVVKVLKVQANDNILMVSSKGLSITFPVESVRVTGRGATGVRLMRLDGGAKVVDAQTLPKQSHQ